MENQNELDLLAASGLEITAKTGENIDPELQRQMKTVFADAVKRLEAERAADADIRARYEKHKVDTQGRFTASKTQVEKAKNRGINPFDAGEEVDVVKIAKSKDELSRYFGSKSDIRLASQLSKTNWLAYDFLKQEARRQGVTR